MPFKFSVLSKRQIVADVMSLVNDVPVDLEGTKAWMAFVAAGALPGSGDWIVAHWSTTLIDGAPAQVISVTVGPNDGEGVSVDTTLGPGTYAVWAKVVTTTEEFVDTVDTITVTGSNSRLLVVSVAEMADYMGYPFPPEQVTAVADRLSEIQGEVEDYLRADLTNQQWTETYTVPMAGPPPYGTPYMGMDYQNLYPDASQFNMAWASGAVELEHWPVTDWVAVAVNNSTSLAQSGLTANAVYTPGVATLTDTTTGAVAAVAAINGQTGPVAANATIFNLAVTAGPVAVNVGDRIVLSDGAGHTLVGIVAVGGVAPHTTSQITVGGGTFGPNDPVWVPVVPPTYPEQLPTFAPGTQVQVTYRAGWDGPNKETIKSTIKRAAARELTNRLDDTVGLRGLSVVRLPDPGGQQGAAPGLTDADKKRLFRYKRILMVS